MGGEKMGRLVIVLAAALAAVFLLAGCGGGGAEPAAQTLNPYEQNVVAHFLAVYAGQPTGSDAEARNLADQVIDITRAKPDAVYTPNAASTVPSRSMRQIVEDIAADLEPVAPDSAAQLLERAGLTTPQ